jgi:hypothetical protein
MYTIYCIEDINGLKYVGRTKQKLNIRLNDHRSNKRMKKHISSSKLDLDNCKIYSLETCNESQKKERERYWINKIDCVNEHKLNGKNKEKVKKYYQENKDKINEYYKNNIHKKKEYDLFRRKHVVNGCYDFIKMLEEY